MRDSHGTSAPLLAIGGIALVTAYLPPDYRGQTHSRVDVKLDSARSHHAMTYAMAYALPRDLRVDQPIYLAVYRPANFPPVGVRITDEHAYRIGDLAHVRASTFFVSVLVSMVLVILCFWVVLRDRMFVYFIVYVSAAKAEGRNRVVVWRREAFEAAVAGTA